MNSNRSIHETKSEAVRAATGTRQDAGVWLTLQAHDAPALIDFLVGTVGFRRTAVYQDGEIVEHAQLDWPEGGGVMLGSYRPDSPVTLRPGTAACVRRHRPCRRPVQAARGRGRQDHPRDPGPPLRQPGVHRRGPGGQRLGLRYLPREPA